jgi:hypothetical protein
MRHFLNTIVMADASVAVLFALLQIVPYGRAHSNPPVVQEPAWDSARTRELAVRACFDCHSNETKWPWYAHVAPLSGVMERDVVMGRSVLNFSEWHRAYDLSAEAGPDVVRRDMPPSKYRMLHDHARLTDAEAEALARGLHTTLGIDHQIVAR